MSQEERTTDLFKMLKIFLFLLLVFETKGERKGRVYNGEIDNNVPYYAQVIVYYDDGKCFYFCGGVILNRYWILTAAHCVLNQKTNDVKVITGAKQRIREGETHDVSYLTTHENYSSWRGINDIALVMLENSLIYNDEQKPVKIRSRSLKTGEKLKASGLGLHGNPNRNDKYPESIESSVLEVIDRKKCQSEYYSPGKVYPMISQNELCLGSEESHTCKGDSGGPAVDAETGELVGISVWGSLGLCTMHAPTVFINVIKYRRWIKQQILFTRNKFVSDVYFLTTQFNLTSDLASSIFNIG